MNPFHYILFALMLYALVKGGWGMISFYLVGCFVSFLGVALQAYIFGEVNTCLQMIGLSLFSLWGVWQSTLMNGRAMRVSAWFFDLKVKPSPTPTNPTTPKTP